MYIAHKMKMKMKKAKKELPHYVNKSTALKMLGVTPKVLKIYEAKGIINPIMSDSGHVYLTSEIEAVILPKALRTLAVGDEIEVLNKNYLCAKTEINGTDMCAPCFIRGMSERCPKIQGEKYPVCFVNLRHDSESVLFKILSK